MLLNKLKHCLRWLANWQHWPFYLFYFPISYAWIGYYLKSRSLWFYTASNPTLKFGGFEGEKKSEMYKQLPTSLCPHSIYIHPAMPFADVVQQIAAHAIQYPFVVKPDVGMKGILFRKIENEQQLQQYHARMPAVYIVQEFIHLPLEVSVFYCRMPNSKSGQITAFIQKDLLEVYGDGVSTLEQLIVQHPQAKRLLTKIKKQYGAQLQQVLPPGILFCVSHIANLFNGARFTDITDKVNAQLIALFDEISYGNQFYYGRYDIKCASVEDMLQGKNFIILEFNGAGSVPNHIYAGRYNLLQAYKEILRHWKVMYEISACNQKKGIAYWDLWKGYRFLRRSKKYFHVLKQLDRQLFLQ